MANHDEMIEVLQVHNDAGVIDDEEILLLEDLNRQRNPQFPYWRYDKFDLEQLEEDECKAEFRMKRGDVYRLVEMFGFPEQLKCYNGVVVDSVEALCVCLRRLAYPCRYGDWVSRFARPVPQLSMMFNLVIGEVFDRSS